jgi:hypothetical protein
MKLEPAIAVVLVFCGTTTATAQLPSRVELGVRTCTAGDAARVEELVRVELAADGIGDVGPITGETEAPALARIAVEPTGCEDAPGVYRIAIDDVATRKRVERDVSMADLEDDARPRALALAIAELLRASWAELAYAEPPAAIPRRVLEAVRLRVPVPEDARELTIPPAVSAADPPVAGPAGAPRYLVDAGALVRSFPGARSALLGGRLAASIAIVPRLRLEVGGEGGAGQSLDRLGKVDLWYAASGSMCRSIRWSSWRACAGCSATAPPRAPPTIPRPSPAKAARRSCSWRHRSRSISSSSILCTSSSASKSAPPPSASTRSQTAARSPASAGRCSPRASASPWLPSGLIRAQRASAARLACRLELAPSSRSIARAQAVGRPRFTRM